MLFRSTVAHEGTNLGGRAFNRHRESVRLHHVKAGGDGQLLDTGASRRGGLSGCEATTAFGRSDAVGGGEALELRRVGCGELEIGDLVPGRQRCDRCGCRNTRCGCLHPCSTREPHGAHQRADGEHTTPHGPSVGGARRGVGAGDLHT